MCYFKDVTVFSSLHEDLMFMSADARHDLFVCFYCTLSHFAFIDTQTQRPFEKGQNIFAVF